jgi:hypothetical protein
LVWFGLEECVLRTIIYYQYRLVGREEFFGTFRNSPIPYHIYAPKLEIIDIHDKELPVYAIKCVLIINVITFGGKVQQPNAGCTHKHISSVFYASRKTPHFGELVA